MPGERVQVRHFLGEQRLGLAGCTVQ
jgi:hypothetical protein